MAKYTEARKAANKKWDAANLTTMSCRVRKTYAEEVKAKAAERGTTVGAIIRKALDEFLQSEE